MKSPEVIVVGGGVMGAATAYELAKRRVDVVLIDCDLPGKATSASARIRSSILIGGNPRYFMYT